MGNICYLSSKEVYKSAYKNGKLFSGTRSYPNLHLFIYGNLVESGKNKSPLFKCRDLISYFKCSICFPDDRLENLEGNMNEVVFYIENNIENHEGKLIANIEVAAFEDIDKNYDAIQCLAKSFYNIVKDEIKTNFRYSDEIIIYWNFSNDYCLFNKDSQVDNALVRYDSYSNIVVLGE